jgi:hypothetical protein
MCPRPPESNVDSGNPATPPNTDNSTERAALSDETVAMRTCGRGIVFLDSYASRISQVLTSNSIVHAIRVKDVPGKVPRFGEEAGKTATRSECKRAKL